MLHHEPVAQVQSKECYFMFTYTFFGIFLLFLLKFVFLLFSFFVDEV